jgi:hypothetical protein
MASGNCDLVGIAILTIAYAKALQEGKISFRDFMRVLKLLTIAQGRAGSTNAICKRDEL